MSRFGFIIIWIWCLSAVADEVIPPAPARYFNDYAQVVNAATADQFNTQLENFERSTGNQVLVAIYPKIQSDSSIDDYTIRVARSWKVGQKEKNNGAVLFVFIADRKMFIQVGYGLEGTLPDAICKQITEYEIKPRFKAGDYAGGLTAGVNAILAATRHEYKGTGTTVYE
ncbi:MAG: TPM domain-containing protein [Limisphaerales bacterium]